MQHYLKVKNILMTTNISLQGESGNIWGVTESATSAAYPNNLCRLFKKHKL